MWFSLLYRALYQWHHGWVLRPGEPLQKSKLVVVGAFLAGGAGKTPLCEFLANEWTRKGKTVAILTHKIAWDETQWLAQQLPNVSIFPSTNRYRLAHELDGKFDILLCDDGFEDSRLVGAYKIALRWGERAESIQDLIPSGKCRSLEKDHQNISLTLLCGNAFEFPDVDFLITKIENEERMAPPQKAIAMCGLGSPNRFFEDLKKKGIILSQKIALKDHSSLFAKRVARELTRGEPIIMSAKDAVRLPMILQKNPLVFVAQQKVMMRDAVFAHINKNLDL
jgi:tetraacyldisaccharide 4'-kinase